MKCSVKLCRCFIYGCFKVDGVLMINNKVFGIILGILVGFFSALIYFFFLLPQLLRMKGDLRISFALFSKKDRRGSVLAEVEDEKMTDSMEMAAENVKNHTLKEELEEEDESREVTLYLCTVSIYNIYDIYNIYSRSSGCSAPCRFWRPASGRCPTAPTMWATVSVGPICN